MADTGCLALAPAPSSPPPRCTMGTSVDTAASGRSLPDVLLAHEDAASCSCWTFLQACTITACRQELGQAWNSALWQEKVVCWRRYTSLQDQHEGAAASARSAAGRTTSSHDVFLHRLILRLALQLVPRLPPEERHAQRDESAETNTGLTSIGGAAVTFFRCTSLPTHLAFPLGSNMPGLPVRQHKHFYIA